MLTFSHDSWGKRWKFSFLLAKSIVEHQCFTTREQIYIEFNFCFFSVVLNCFLGLPSPLLFSSKVSFFVLSTNKEDTKRIRIRGIRDPSISRTKHRVKGNNRNEKGQDVYTGACKTKVIQKMAFIWQSTFLTRRKTTQIVWTESSILHTLMKLIKWRRKRRKNVRQRLTRCDELHSILSWGRAIPQTIPHPICSKFIILFMLDMLVNLPEPSICYWPRRPGKGPGGPLWAFLQLCALFELYFWKYTELEFFWLVMRCWNQLEVFFHLSLVWD